MSEKRATVYLKATRRKDISLYHPTLVHAVAHVKHFFIDPEYSNLWLSKFPIDRKIDEDWDDENVSEKNGLVDRRAAIDHTRDNITINFPETHPDFMEIVDGISFELYGDKLNPNKAIDNILNEFKSLPWSLRGYVRHIVFYPGLNVLGAAKVYGDLSDDFERVTEDIAYSTSGLYAASVCPEGHRDLITRLHENETTRARLEFLLETGFLDYKQSEKLLDPKFRNKYLIGKTEEVVQETIKLDKLRPVRTSTMLDGMFYI